MTSGSDQIMILTCDSEESASSAHSDLAAIGSSSRIISRNNLTGDQATWMVALTTAITTLPKILDSLAKLIEASKIRSIKIGDREIKNPTSADIRALRQQIAG